MREAGDDDRDRARRALGNVTLIAEDTRAMGIFGWLESVAARRALWPPSTAPLPDADARRHPLPRHRHWRQHRYLQPGRRRAAQAASGARPARPRHPRMARPQLSSRRQQHQRRISRHRRDQSQGSSVSASIYRQLAQQRDGRRAIEGWRAALRNVRRADRPRRVSRSRRDRRRHVSRGTDRRAVRQRQLLLRPPGAARDRQAVRGRRRSRRRGAARDHQPSILGQSLRRVPRRARSPHPHQQRARANHRRRARRLLRPARRRLARRVCAARREGRVSSAVARRGAGWWKTTATGGSG